MNAGVAAVIDDDTGIVHYAYFAPEAYWQVQRQLARLVISTTLCIRGSTRLAKGQMVTCVECVAKYYVTYCHTMPVIDGT